MKRLVTALLAPTAALTFALTATTMFSACPPTADGPAVETIAFDRTGLLTGVVDKALLPRFDVFIDKANALVAATTAHAATPTDEATLTAARTAWAEAMAAWQSLEILQLGPMAASGTRVGAEGLRDGIYSWPVSSACGVDQNVVDNEFDGAGWAAGQLVNVTGLAAIEATLFSDDDDNACPGSATINTDGSWNALSEAQVHARRAGLAKVLAADVVTRAEALKAKMVTYGEQLKTAGDGSTLFATAQAGVDEVYAALFYIELKVKDRKLGAPAGLTLDCPASACPELLESPLSKTSKDHVLVNLHALKEVYEGVDGAPGFDDFLAAADAQELSAEIVGEIDAAIAGVEAYAGTFEEHVVADPAKVAALYELVKTFADDFKADLASTLAVRVPAEGAGDND